MSPQLSDQNGLSKYILLISGIVCIAGDFKYENLQEPTQKDLYNLTNSYSTSKSICNAENKTVDVIVTETEANSKKVVNPYDYPEDF